MGGVFDPAGTLTKDAGVMLSAAGGAILGDDGDLLGYLRLENLQQVRLADIGPIRYTFFDERRWKLMAKDPVCGAVFIFWDWTDLLIKIV